ncbi:MAG: hypothetical protein R6U51_02630 [Anaerolineales bacterium]
MRNSLLLILGLIVVIMLLVSTANPETYRGQQGVESNTDSPTLERIQTNANKPLQKQSGNTQKIKISAAVIVLIILGGVLLQKRDEFT